MAKDVKIKFDNDLKEGDVILGNGDLERDEGLESAVLISLYTDRRAEDSDPYDNKDKRGWWADQIAEIEGDLIGSRLYLLERAKATQQNALLMKVYVFEALEWMIDDKVVAKIEVDTFMFGDSSNKRLGFIVKIYKSNGNVVEMKFDSLWEHTHTINS